MSTDGPDFKITLKRLDLDRGIKVRDIGRIIEVDGDYYFVNDNLEGVDFPFSYDPTNLVSAVMDASNIQRQRPNRVELFYDPNVEGESPSSGAPPMEEPGEEDIPF